MGKQTVTAKSTRRSFGPGRSPLRQAQGARRRQLFNIWYHYSTRLQRDVVLRSDVEFAHFCYLEGAENISRYELEPEPVVLVVDGHPQRTQFDALVEFRDRAPQLREVRTSESQLSAREISQRESQTQAAREAGFEYVRITWTELEEHTQLICNWRAALAYLAAAREFPMEQRCVELCTQLARQRRCTLHQLLSHTDPALRPLYLAALFKCLQEARLSSDLHAQPLCEASVICLREAQHE
jgi:hypothetical protein